MGDDPTPQIAADLILGVGDRALAVAKRTLAPSPLDLVFDRELTGCVHTGPVYNAATGARLSSEWVRVGISNSSAGSIEGVRVHALKLDPDTLGTLPAQLHRMHDNPPPGRPNEPSVTVPLSKSPVVFVDVVAHLESAPVFQLLHIVPAIEQWFPIDSYMLTLVVTGEGVKSRERIFSLELVDGRIEFSRLS
jgi:hypothetical protein